MTTDPDPLRSLDPHRAEVQKLFRVYWRKNLLVMAFSLVVWATVSLGCGVLWAEVLNAYQLFGTGYPLGFWFAQQGSILTFVLIIFCYSLYMNRLDRQHRESLLALAQAGGQG